MALAFITVMVLNLFAADLKQGENKGMEMTMDKFHQEQAVTLFNQSWELLLKEGRNRQDEDILVNMVHASLYHWRQIGKPINILRGEWMICHVYTLLKHKEEALYHADNVLRLMDEQKPEDWDLAYCYEAMARTQAMLGNKEQFSKYNALAEEAGKKIVEDGDKKQFDGDMKDEYWFGLK
jgi:hypothetical protein